MKTLKKWILPMVLLASIIVIKCYVNDAERVEKGYSQQFFPSFSLGLRTLTTAIPFSIGDLLYGSLACWLLLELAKMLYKRIKRKQTDQFKLRGQRILYRIAVGGAIVYIVFNLFWGINYNRKGVAWQMGLPDVAYSSDELKLLNYLLLQKVNSSKTAVLSAQQAYPSHQEMFSQAAAAYDSLHKTYPFLAYKPVSLKTSLWGWLGNYASFTGYYNPFTGEAQVNTTVPKFLQPFTTCHEIAHQLGYAKEMEANFVGYLAAKASKKPLFAYSAYLDMFLYANRNLYITDSSASKAFIKRLSKPVQNDLNEWKRFNQTHRGFFEPMITWAYGKFLESNEQPEGILSYDAVTGFLIAYYRKFGEI
jgi:hypothetical protein